MAAAEYYNPGGQQPAGPQPGLAPPSSQGNLNPPYPLSDAPPPYSQFDQNQRPHSQPPPQHRPPPPSQPYHPPPPSNGYSQYPPDKNGRPPVQSHQSHGAVPNMYKPSDFAGPYTPQPYQQPQPQPHPQQQQPPYQPPPQGYFPLAGTPAMQQVYGNSNGNANLNGDGRRPSTTPGYRPPRSPYRDDSDRSRSRSRGGGHHKHHHQHSGNKHHQKKKSSGVNTFLGAGGGAIIGDAIFPGLGTLGGAILGGFGGHEYGKQRRSYSNPGAARAKGRSYSNDNEYYYEDDGRRGRKY